MTIFGIGPMELIIIVLIALVVVGPERLPELMFQVGQGVSKVKKVVMDLREQARSELGEDYDSIEEFGRQIRTLNPRQQIQDLSRSLLVDEPITKTTPPPPPNETPVPSAPPAIADLARSVLTDDLLDVPLDEMLAPAKETNDEHTAS